MNMPRKTKLALLYTADKRLGVGYDICWRHGFMSFFLFDIERDPIGYQEGAQELIFLHMIL